MSTFHEDSGLSEGNPYFTGFSVCSGMLDEFFFYVLMWFYVAGARVGGHDTEWCDALWVPGDER
jgi:hypothetical protein